MEEPIIVCGPGRVQVGDLVERIVNKGAEYFTDHRIEALVLGLSGGIDSALVAGLARLMVNKMEKPPIIIGHVMPIETNKDDETARGLAIGKAFCDEVHVDELEGAFNHLLAGIDPVLKERKNNSQAFPDNPANKLTVDEKIFIGNIKARTRMIKLYHEAGKHRGLVLSTDNFTEFNLGFWTLHGDVGDYGPIQELWKTEAYTVADYLATFIFWGAREKALCDCINAEPTDGLGVTQAGDIGQLLPDWDASKGGHREAYKLIDRILVKCVVRRHYNPRCPITIRHLATEFKRQNPISVCRSDMGLELGLYTTKE